MSLGDHCWFTITQSAKYQQTISYHNSLCLYSTTKLFQCTIETPYIYEIKANTNGYSLFIVFTLLLSEYLSQRKLLCDIDLSYSSNVIFGYYHWEATPPPHPILSLSSYFLAYDNRYLLKRYMIRGRWT